MKILTMYDMGLAIRDARDELGLTQEQLASKAHVSRSWLAQVETGKAAFDFRRVLMVMAALNQHIEVLPNE
ncbi:helix-turn-helix domain-containing protein [Bifidobacterium oedipodis]|uniref:XRE family transcriptional regulator n=1 Tax=Bifidobacterium oedipodis TaxID=2675322 RepID=A0A7Y0EQY8_9BIFI|nr:helix-turn-helix domain-containing protein [Bifidobacterium sp. DSM 109957]NMM94734.1 XRE family transcriptional regulator [Bifidobacterium sp. DSM 109957]